MDVTKYRTMTDAELCREVMSQDADPLSRELAQRLEKILYATDEDDEDCPCIACSPEKWS